MAGFPCQPYSLAGAGCGSRDERAHALPYIVMYIRTGIPNTFLLERVKGLATHT
eukprot:NODE_30960_length_407_cov_0.810714.p3 GENE.NODE_30960_length_407_cov_0.810714~~NODE_30960_length_407_cov_0.810714.p3  ORF type:complete len:54 (+),score=6.63 NODE_30960_length_407_cov_0.810714:164-325(+)